MNAIEANAFLADPENRAMAQRTHQQMLEETGSAMKALLLAAMVYASGAAALKSLAPNLEEGFEGRLVTEIMKGYLIRARN